MGIYLPNMEMPQKGQMLVISPGGTSYVCFNGMGERLTQTTAFPVPSHGRLVDADAMNEKYGDWYTEEGTEEGFIGTLKYLIAEQPTIIEAEGT